MSSALVAPHHRSAAATLGAHPRATTVLDSYGTPHAGAPSITSPETDGVRLTRAEVELAREGIPARIDARAKRPFSVYQKINRQKVSLDQIFATGTLDT